MRRILLPCLLLLLLTSRGHAQGDIERRGAWGMFAIGAGSAGVDCGFCEGNRAWGPSGMVAFGGTPSRRVLVGGGASGIAKTAGDTDTYLGWALGLVRAYPSASLGVFVSGGAGVGYGRGTSSADAFDALGAGFLVGLGWDFGLGPSLGVTAIANFLLTAGGYLKQNDVQASGSFNPTLFQFGLGVTMF
ncbi:MAG: hypothetical protein OEW06_05960 [Gemmatimonadota bacterium]|nr:hypothetical protein [Gemmatimonadota bacterium]